ncbi:hypothetical protein PYW07_015068 [Mythimna separata]|uniref:Reverse transcriptase domain-containing protein n=1 Tax=Mythimna separata TaxID=271217 RepID=A0AAD8DZ55_MYTSE|nr:hypothetical protein PYW07_015068 [Mythimna separata]
MTNQLIYDLDSFSVSESKVCNVGDCKHLLPSGDKTLTLLTQNIRSINRNLTGFEVLLQDLDVSCDILVLTECWLSKNTTNLPSLDGYYSYRSNININQNDGVVVYIKNNLRTIREEPVFLDSNCLIIKIVPDTVVMAIYRPPSQNLDRFLDSLDTNLKNLTSFKNIILLGDININIASGKTDTNIHNYLNICSFHGLLPAHYHPTHQSGSCLDHIILKSKNPSTTLVTNSTLTDHQAVLLSLQISSPRNNCMRSCTKINMTNLENDIRCIDLDPVYNSDDVNSSLNYFINSLQSAIKKNTFTKTMPRKYSCIKPWITPGLVRCIRHRDRLHLKLKLTPDDEGLSITYKRYRNFCNNLLKKLKNQYDKNELQKAGKNSKLLWKFVKSYTFRSKKLEPPLDILLSDINPIEAINKTNSFFVNVGKNLAEKTLNSSNISQHNSTTTSSTLNSFVLLDTDVNEVVRIISGLKDVCATGWDGIPNNILKRFKYILAPPLTHIFQLCLSKGIFPKLLKKAVVTPVFKSGDKTSVNNYRPISVLSGLSKILEKIINSRLIKYLEDNSLLSDGQFGFRAKKSTSQAVHTLTNYVTTNLDNGMHTIGIFLDLAKAFDTISCFLLLHKLETLGIRGQQLLLFSDYLSDRHQCVKIDQYTSSDLKNTSFGIPQGSILGPTLFLIYINELCSLSLQNGVIMSYADDTAILFSGKSLVEVYEYAQNGFNIVSNWLQKNLLSLNADKTNYILFTMRNTNIPLTNLNIYAHNCTYADTACTCPTLVKADHVKYLGVTIDTNLNFRKHIELLCTRVRKLIYVFKNLRNIADYKLIKQVYLALCQSILTYCITSWGGAAKTILLQLERAQRAILKVATFRPFRFPTQQLYIACKVLTVRQLFILNTVLFQHSALPFDPVPSDRRRKDLVCIKPQTRHAFARRFYVFLGPFLYNRLNKVLSFYNFRYKKCSKMISEYLLTLNYIDTEQLLEILA